jgi:hypothetical protein
MAFDLQPPKDIVDLSRVRLNQAADAFLNLCESKCDFLIYLVLKNDVAFYKRCIILLFVGYFQSYYY